MTGQLLDALIGLLTGILSGCGIGGGSLLMLWLTQVQGVSQLAAGGMNLLYFLCCAPPALVAHRKNHLLDGRAIRWCIAGGLPVSIAAAGWAAQLDLELLRRGFGLLLVYIGIRELFCTKTPHQNGAQSCRNGRNR